MAAKRFSSPGVIIVLLAISLVGGGCATTSQTADSYKPHKPQMITANGPEEVGTSDASKNFSNGFSLSDGWASFLTAMRPVFQILGGFANR
jgi:hypothetical protein